MDALGLLSKPFWLNRSVVHILHKGSRYVKVHFIYRFLRGKILCQGIKDRYILNNPDKERLGSRVLSG